MRPAIAKLDIRMRRMRTSIIRLDRQFGQWGRSIAISDGSGGNENLASDAPPGSAVMLRDNLGT
jgi:hypothetical protein